MQKLCHLYQGPEHLQILVWGHVSWINPLKILRYSSPRMMGKSPERWEFHGWEEAMLKPEPR